MNNPLILFLKELVNRLGAKTPKFFKVLAWIGSVTAVIGFVPETLALFDITLPEAWAPSVAKVMKIAGSITAFISLLTTTSPTVGVTENGDLLKHTDATKMPFTAKNEIKKAPDNLPVLFK